MLVPLNPGSFHSSAAARCDTQTPDSWMRHAIIKLCRQLGGVETIA
jgi:hypothetical protein